MGHISLRTRRYLSTTDSQSWAPNTFASFFSQGNNCSKFFLECNMHDPEVVGPHEAAYMMCFVPSKTKRTHYILSNFLLQWLRAAWPSATIRSLAETPIERETALRAFEHRLSFKFGHLAQDCRHVPRSWFIERAPRCQVSTCEVCPPSIPHVFVADSTSALASVGSLSHWFLPRAISSNSQVLLLFPDAKIMPNAHHFDTTDVSAMAP